MAPERGLLDCDTVVFVTEAPKPSAPAAVHEEDLAVLEALEASNTPVVLVINKVRQAQARGASLRTHRSVPGEACVRGHRAHLGHERDQSRRFARRSARCPEGLIYDPDFLTDRPEQFLVSELVREAAMLNTRQEVPYGIACGSSTAIRKRTTSCKSKAPWWSKSRATKPS